MKIYFEFGTAVGVNVTYDVQGERCYDYFSSLCKFHVWAEAVYPHACLVLITDENYCQLATSGVL